MDKVWQLIKKLNKVVADMIDDITNKINDLKTKIKDFENQMLNKVQEQVNKVVNKILDELEKIEKDALALDEDVSECVDQNEKDIELIAGAVFLDTARCITKNTLKAFQILDDAMAETKEIMNEVNALEDEYEKCSTATCYMKMSVKITGLLVSLPARGTKLFLKAQKTLLLIQLDVTSCVSEKMLKLQDDVETTFDTVNKCVIEIIGNKDNNNNNKSNRLQ